MNSGSRIVLYIGKPDSGRPHLVLRLQYYADEWLFIDRFMIKADGRDFVIDPGDFDIERDNSTDIWEWYSNPNPTRSELEMVRVVANAKRAVIRYEGKQYYKDRTIGPNEKQKLRRVLAAYEALGGS